MKIIRYGQQHIDEDDIQAVVDVLKSDYLTCGPAVEKFEQAMEHYTGASFALATSNATTALHLACCALKLGVGDRLWTSPNTFVASANCGLYCGATVDFVDIDLTTYNLSITHLTQKLITAKACNQLPKVVVVVHFAGAACDMVAIYRLAQEYGFNIIEDASHAIGARYNNGQPVGSCQYADFTVFSLHPVKIITSGEGGVLLTNNSEHYANAKLLRSHGVTRDTKRYQATDQGPWYYEMQALGFNYRITDIQCALATSQLTKVNKFVSERQRLAQIYDQGLHDLPLTLPYRQPQQLSALHLYPILIEQNKANKNRQQVFTALQTAGIGVNVHYIPVHTQPFYQQLGFKTEDFPNAMTYYQKTISLPLYYGLSEADQTKVIQTLYEILL